MTFRFSDDDRRLIAAVRDHQRWQGQAPLDPWTAETLALIYGECERRWANSQWWTVDVSTGKPMKLASVTRWWTTLTAQASPTDE